MQSLLGSEPGPATTATTSDSASAEADRSEIATVINDVRKGFADGDGALVCDRLTQKGAAEMAEQDIVPLIEQEVDAHLEGKPLEKTCESAVTSFTEGLTSSQRRELEGVLTYRSGDIDLSHTPVANPEVVLVPCLESPSKTWVATEEDGEWKVTFPFCTMPLTALAD